MIDSFYIWSYEHNAWWGHDSQGYTAVFTKAGVYSEEFAQEICDNSMGEEVMVPAAQAEWLVRECPLRLWTPFNHALLESLKISPTQVKNVTR